MPYLFAVVPVLQYIQGYYSMWCAAQETPIVNTMIAFSFAAEEYAFEDPTGSPAAVPMTLIEPRIGGIDQRSPDDAVNARAFCSMVTFHRLIKTDSTGATGNASLDAAAVLSAFGASVLGDPHLTAFATGGNAGNSGVKLAKPGQIVMGSDNPVQRSINIAGMAASLACASLTFEAQWQEYA